MHIAHKSAFFSHSRLVMRPQLSCIIDKLLESLVFLMRWLQLLFDFDSTAVRRSFECLSKVIGHTDVIRVPPPFRLAASVSWCWSWENEGRAVEVVPGIYAVHWKFSMCTDTRTSSYSPVGPNVFVYLVQVCTLCVHLCFFICLYVPSILCFPEQLSHLPCSFWR